MKRFVRFLRVLLPRLFFVLFVLGVCASMVALAAVYGPSVFPAVALLIGLCAVIRASWTDSEGD